MKLIKIVRIFETFIIWTINPFPPIKVNIYVFKVIVQTKADTGASTTLLNCSTFNQTNAKWNLVLFLIKSKLKSCSGEFVASKVWAKVKISYKVETIRSKLLVTSEKYPNVLVGDVVGVLLLS